VRPLRPPSAAKSAARKDVEREGFYAARESAGSGGAPTGVYEPATEGRSRRLGWLVT